VGRGEPELQEYSDGHQKRRDQYADADGGDGILGPRAADCQRAIDQEPQEREGDGEPDPMGDHRSPPVVILSVAKDLSAVGTEILRSLCSLRMTLRGLIIVGVIRAIG
jgi:hypothetical protein